MGTNYYVYPVSSLRVFHLGKSSAGLQFLHYAEPEWPREDAHRLWMQRASSGPISDEYEERISLEDLLRLIEAGMQGRSHIDPDNSLRDAVGTSLYSSLRLSDFRVDGRDFCDRQFS